MQLSNEVHALKGNCAHVKVGMQFSKHSSVPQIPCKTGDGSMKTLHSANQNAILDYVVQNDICIVLHNNVTNLCHDKIK